MHKKGHILMVGRIFETQELERLYDSDESEFVAVYGRRRVGKTYLVREVFEGRFTFQHTGLPRGRTHAQLTHFYKSLTLAGLASRPMPKNWMSAFEMLKSLIADSRQSRKTVFIDEMPWMDTPKSDFLMALEAFWNEWASARTDVLLIVCGSAAAWMVKNLFRNRGGLHNRITARLHLEPFTLCECEKFIQERGLEMTRRDITECYMVLGGIPFYWRQLVRGLSVAQNIDRLFFSKNASLRSEFEELYSSLFKDADIYKKIVRALSTKKIGMTRLEISDAAELKSTGKLTDALETLESSGFIRRYRSLGNKKRNSIYQLIDNFTLFHFKFLDDPSSDETYWTSISSSPAKSSWRGLAFERVCLQHHNQIRKSLGFAAVHTEVYGWSHRGDDVYPTGAQIDLIFERDDNVINVCEIKYSDEPFAIDKRCDRDLASKLAAFKGVTKTTKAVHLTMITSAGLVRNAYWNRVQSELSLDELFTPASH